MIKLIEDKTGKPSGDFRCGDGCLFRNDTKAMVLQRWNLQVSHN